MLKMRPLPHWPTPGNAPSFRNVKPLRVFAPVIACLVLTLAGSQGLAAQRPDQILPGVWRFTFGKPEKITPVSTRHYAPANQALAALKLVADCPIAPSGTVSERGVLVHLPLEADDAVYGLGLQFQSFQQNGLKKKLRVNADPVMDTGDSHAPVPFYVTTPGYGVLVDTARYATFYIGGKKLKPGCTRWSRWCFG